MQKNNLQLLPTEEILARDISIVIDLLKAGCFITFKKDPRDGETNATFQNVGPSHKDHQWRDYPLDDFKLLKDNHFLALESCNLEFGDWHYYWSNELVYVDSKIANPWWEAVL